jgi:hypothetical protein
MSSTLTSRFRAKLETDTRTRRKSRLLSLTQAVVVILVFLAMARFVTVLVTSFREEPVFSAPKTIYLPQRELEHQMAVAEFQNAAATPSTIPALTTESLLANMSALPQVPDVNFTPVESEAMITESDALFGQSGLMGALGALSSQASSVSFLGITEEASRFVIVVDVSSSVVEAVKAAGMDFDVIKEESEKLINNLNANTLFGFVLHGRTYLPFQESLIPATVDNKQLAIDWLNSRFNSSGGSPSGARKGPNGTNGLLPILDASFAMQPDVIFLVSNGGYFTNNDEDNQPGPGGFGRPVELRETLSRISDLQEQLTEDVRIHAIHFVDPRDIRDDGRIGSDMRSIATRNGGKYRKIGN